MTQGRDGGLQFADLATHDEFLTLDDRGDRPGDVLFDRKVLGLEVKQGNRHVSNPQIRKLGPSPP
jgi:hypothetical protein